MTLVDSADSILMLYAYAGVPDHAFSLFEKHTITVTDTSGGSERIISSSDPDGSTEPDRSLTPDTDAEPLTKRTKIQDQIGDIEAAPELLHDPVLEGSDDTQMDRRKLRVKQHTMSGLSIALTLISILVAFRYVSFAHQVRNVIGCLYMHVDAAYRLLR